jgi:hypothetical protein
LLYAVSLGILKKLPRFTISVIYLRCRIKQLIAVSAVLAIGLSFLFAAVSSAEENANTSIFEYKKELALTDKQEKNLRGILEKLQKYMTAKAEELNRLRAELNKMIADRADLSRIKVRLQTIAQIQADATYEDIASARAIENELSAAQISKWHGIQEGFRKKVQAAQAAQAAAPKAAVSDRK